jgi:UDP-N-acetylmuramate--alanine ligase
MKKINEIKSIYFVGIKGIAMTALAIYAKEKGYQVIGSDISEEFPSDTELKRHGIKVLAGFSEKNIQDYNPDLIIYTGAHGGSGNIEVIMANNLNIPVYSQGQALGVFMEGYRQVSVAGCHGKTTTASMIASTMVRLKYDPSFAIGVGEISGIGSAGHAGTESWFIAEADEYVTDPGHDQTPRFLWQNPQILIITNIDYDHPDVYLNLKEVQEAYLKISEKVPKNGTIILNGDDINSKYLIKSFPGSIRVGLSVNNHYQIRNIKFGSGQTNFQIYEHNNFIGQMTIRVPGVHNVLNASMSAVALNCIGITWDKIILGLSKYTGSKRRFELLGIKNSIRFYDDYAHHPTEIQSTLSSIKSWFPKNRIISIFQPHTYSRTKALINEFGYSFGNSDFVIITDIYASARELPLKDFNSENLVECISKHHQHVYYFKSPDIVEIQLKKLGKPGDIIIFMGAGNIYNWSRKIVENY